MKLMTTMLAGGAGLAAIAAAAPAAAQYYPYGYASPYSSPYSYNRYNSYGVYGLSSNVATQQCTAAVQNKLYNRTSLAGILGSLIGLPTNSYGRVLSITQAYPRSGGGYTIRGLASSGRTAYNNYGPYGVGAYGSLGYNYANAADLSFKCSVDARGYVRDVDVNRRY